MPNIQYQQVSLGVPTSVLQNETFALPSIACTLLSSVALELGMAQTGPFTAAAASTTGMQTAATWARCPTAAAVVTAGRIG
jgi:hypothetical protein